MHARKCDAVTARESETVTLKICRDKQTEFADKWREQVTAQRDYHKGRARGGGGGTKDVPGLSLYTSPPSFH